MEDFKYTYHCPTCGYDCVTHFYSEPFVCASFTCCCGNDILIENVNHEEKVLVCSSLDYDGFITA